MMTYLQTPVFSQPKTLNAFQLANSYFEHTIDFKSLIPPETKLESELLSLPEFEEGYNWGKPRFGHPEGKVGFHVREVLDNVDDLDLDRPTRDSLRLITLVHDTFKYQERKVRHFQSHNHHGVLARRFMENFISEKPILDIIELHDEAYYVWRFLFLQNKPDLAWSRFDSLLKRLDKHLPLYFLFFKCDTQTGDKIQAPLRWFEQQLKELKVLP
jgi:hypothetical protein